MDYYFDVDDKAVKNKSKGKHTNSSTNNDVEKSNQTEHAIQNTDLLGIHETFNECITNQI